VALGVAEESQHLLGGFGDALATQLNERVRR
jgi:hypothetical protein